MQAPLVKNDHRLGTLRRAANLIMSWSSSKCPGMTAATSLAWSQTLLAVADLAEDLLENYDFDYFLPGKVLSDVIEARFGCYRQMSGANYFMSVTQLLNSEKKIRVLSKLRDLKAVIFSTPTNIALVKDALPEDEKRRCTDLDASDIANELQCITSADQVPLEDRNVIYYVSGFVGRSVSRQKKCPQCGNMLLDSKAYVLLDIDDNLRSREEFSTLLQMADRGGLAKPSDYTFSTSLLMYQYYNQIIQHPDLKQKFIASANHFNTYFAVLQRMFSECDATSMLMMSACSNGHMPFRCIASSLFHCFGHIVTDCDSRISSNKRKLYKLQSMSK